MISSNFFKLFEYCIYPLFNKSTVLSPMQFGYRNNTSTVLATTVFKETVKKFVTEGSTVYTCFLDLSKAFERVDHNILLRRLLYMNVPVYLVNILKNMLLNTGVCVNYCGEYSEKWLIKSGVRQGGILSAYLFSIYIDEILTKVSKIKIGCTLGLNRVNIQAYADDIVLLAPSASGLQRLLNTVGCLFNESCLNINMEKTVTMIFSKSSNVLLNNLVFNINNNVLTNVKEYKYLGTIISSDLSERLDMDRCNNVFNKSFGFLFRKFSSVDTDVLFSLFNSFCTSFYGSELWINRKKATAAFKHVSVSYHIALKKILGFPKYFSNHYTCSILNTMTFEHFINFKTLRYMFWLRNCSSPCFFKHKHYFMQFSILKHDFYKLWCQKYNVKDVFNNDIDALKSRIYFIQNREPTSMFLGL